MCPVCSCTRAASEFSGQGDRGLPWYLMRRTSVPGLSLVLAVVFYDASWVILACYFFSVQHRHASVAGLVTMHGLNSTSSSPVLSWAMPLALDCEQTPVPWCLL